MYIYSILIFLTVIIIGLVFTSFTSHTKRKTKYQLLNDLEEQLENINHVKNEEHMLDKMYKKYFKSSMEKGIFYKFSKLLKINTNDLQKKLWRAGIEDLSPEALASFKIFCFFLIMLSLPVFFLTNQLVTLLFPFVCTLGYILPDFILKSMYKSRRSKILDDYTFFLRLVAEATSKGLNERAAFLKVSNGFSCLLTKEFQKAEKKSLVGYDWYECIEETINKMDIEELKLMFMEMKISKQRGTPVSEVFERLVTKTEAELKHQFASEARIKSVTMTIPTIIFLFIPTIALLILPMTEAIFNVL